VPSVYYIRQHLLKVKCKVQTNISKYVLPYEQYYIQTPHHEGKLIPEQSPGETNPLFQMAINPQPRHPTRRDQ